MPPKKKHKVDVKPGVAQEQISKTYSGVLGENLQNGHVLLIYLENGSSLTEIEKSVKLKIANKQQSDLPPLKNRIKRLVDRTLHKLKKLTNTIELEQFSANCAEAFSVTGYVHIWQQLEQPPVKAVPAKVNLSDGK